jgi:UDP-glucose 4-epimerase
MMFSSSAATYGLPDLPAGSLIHEDAGNRPISPYGETKLVCEWMIRAAGPAWGLRSVNLRYFNVAGAGWDDLGDPGIFNLVPIVMRQLLIGEKPQIFGDDYPTPDGTCVRDYVHVLDLADSHLAALDYLDRADRPYDVFNVGTGTGASVIEVLGQVAESTGYSVEPVVIDRRPGDPASLVADVTRIQDVLGWKASNSDLTTIVESAWSAWPAIHGPTS